MPNKLHIPPPVNPGLLSRQDAGNINRAMRDLYAWVNAFAAAPPLMVAENYSGVQLGFDIQSAVSGNDSVPFEGPVEFNDDVTFSNVNIRYNSSTEINNNRTWTANNITVNGAVFGGLGFGLWTAGLEICGWQFWCCDTYTFTSTTVQDFVLPGPATVFPITPHSGGTTLYSIVPVAVIVPVQTTQTPARTLSGTSQAASFPAATTANNTLIVHVFGKSAAALSSRSVTDSGSNTYTEDKYTRDTTSGVFAGIYRASSAAATSSATFSFSGTAGVVEVIGVEVYGLQGSPVDVSSSATGSSSTPLAGSLTPSLYPYDYMALTLASAETTQPGSVTPPTSSANLYKELDGANYVVGSADFHLTSDTTTYTPTYTTDAAARWAAVGVAYKGKPAPQKIVFTNDSTITFTLALGSASYTSGLGYPIEKPSSYGSTLAMGQYDSTELWFDGCDGDGWRVFDTTVTGKSTLTTTDNTNTDASTSTITFGSGLTYTKGTGGSAGNDTVTASGVTFSGAHVGPGSGVISVPVNTATNLTTTATSPPVWYDTDNYWGTLGGGQTSATIPFTGYYDVDCWVEWDGLPAGATNIELSIMKGSGPGEYIAHDRIVSPATGVTPGFVQGCDGSGYFAAGDLIYYVVQFAGTSGNTLILDGRMNIALRPGK